MLLLLLLADERLVAAYLLYLPFADSRWPPPQPLLPPPLPIADTGNKLPPREEPEPVASWHQRLSTKTAKFFKGLWRFLISPIGLYAVLGTIYELSISLPLTFMSSNSSTDGDHDADGEPPPHGPGAPSRAGMGAP